MKKPSSYLALAALAFIPVSFLGQTTPAHTPARTVTRRPVSGAIPLPKNIPVVPGIPKSLYALRYIDIKVGSGAAAMPGWRYSVHYTGWLYDGTKFDSSVDRGTPFDFSQGQRRVISGWDTGFEGMKVGGKRRLFIPYQLAYGEQGRSKIPPKANLIFDIELVDQHDPSVPPPAPPAPLTPPTPPPAAGDATPPASHPTTSPEPKPQ